MKRTNPSAESKLNATAFHTLTVGSRISDPVRQTNVDAHKQNKQREAATAPRPAKSQAGNSEDGSEYLDMRGLRRRGWSKSMVQHILGVHDKELPGKHGGPPVKAYELAHVQQAEETQAFYVKRAAFEARSQKAREIEDLLHKCMDELAKTLPFTVPRLTEEELKNAAIDWQSCNDPTQITSPTISEYEGNPTLMKLLLRDYLFYHSFPFEARDRFFPFYHTTGNQQITITNRVCCAISQAYPYLAKECQDRMRN